MGLGMQRPCAELPAALGGTDRAYGVLNWPACLAHLLAMGPANKPALPPCPSPLPHAQHLPLTLPPSPLPSRVLAPQPAWCSSRAWGSGSGGERKRKGRRTEG